MDFFFSALWSARKGVSFRTAAKDEGRPLKSRENFIEFRLQATPWDNILSFVA